MSAEKRESSPLFFVAIGLCFATFGLLIMLTVLVQNITEERQEADKRARQTREMYERLYKEKTRADSVIAANCIQWAGR